MIPSCSKQCFTARFVSFNLLFTNDLTSIYLINYFFIYFQFDQMPLGLPSREYFLKDSSEKERKAYLKLMTEIAVLFGAEREISEIDMADVLDLETKIANVRS